MMDRVEPSIFTRQKKLKKLIKLIEGRNEVPSSQISRIESQISQLGQELNTLDINRLKIEYLEITERTRCLNNQFKYKIDTPNHIINWYLRPLISHFDSPKKIDALSSNKEGLAELQDKINLFLPPGMWSGENDEMLRNLDLYYQFKSMGRGKCKGLKTEFYNLFNISDRNPFEYTTIGKNNLPVFHYKVDEFYKNLELGECSTVVTGLCPISGISNELTIIPKSGNRWQPELGFESLPLPDQDLQVADIVFPSRPILSDYIAIRNLIEVLNKFNKDGSNGKVSGLLWYPNAEYIMDFTELIFLNWLESDLITRSQIIEGFNTLESKYRRLVEVVVQDEGFEGVVEFRVTQGDDIELFKRILANMDLSRIKKTYGMWKAPESRKRLYQYLILKHILPALNGNNTMHIENSYEMWLNIQGSRAVQDIKDASTYSWICYPSVPSLNISFMRDYNAPYDDKLYLGEPSYIFNQKIQDLSKNYIFYILPQIFDLQEESDLARSKLRVKFIKKMLKINKFLNL
jgi:hypothetical protein